MTGIGDIIGGGFGLLVRRPGAVLAWTLLNAIPVVLSLVFVMPAMIGSVESLGSVDSADPVAMQAITQAMNSVAGLSWLLNLLSYAIAAVVICAAFRAIFRPEDRSLASLRLGWDEFRMFAMIVVTLIALAILFFILALLAMLPILLLAFLLSNAPTASVTVGLAIGFALFAGMAYILVRLSMMFPLSFLYGRIAIDEGWGIARGRMWTLFLAYFAIWVAGVVLAVVLIVPIALVAISSMPAIASGELDNSAVAAWMLSMRGWVQGHAAVLGLTLLGSALVSTIWQVTFAGAMASAALGFLRDDGRLPPDMAPEEAF